MGWLSVFVAFGDTYKKGKQLTNSAAWKNRAVSTGIIVAIIQFGLLIAKAAGYDLGADDQLVVTLANGISGFGVLVVTSLHIQTTDKIGFK